MLGPTQPVTYFRTSNGTPAEQAIHWQRLRPGSGCLSVKTITDGPTRVLQVTDFILKAPNRSEDSIVGSPDNAVVQSNLLQLQMRFKNGLGISVVNHSPPEELAYCRLSNISMELITNGDMLSIDASVGSIQIDNSLQDPQCPVVVYVTPHNDTRFEDLQQQRALRLEVHRQMTGKLNADIFKEVIVTFKNLTINFDEDQLFKLLAFAGLNQSDLELERIDEGDFEAQRSLNAATSIEAKRYYLGILKLVLDQVSLFREDLKDCLLRKCVLGPLECLHLQQITTGT